MVLRSTAPTRTALMGLAVAGALAGSAGSASAQYYLDDDAPYLEQRFGYGYGYRYVAPRPPAPIPQRAISRIAARDLGRDVGAHRHLVLGLLGTVGPHRGLERLPVDGDIGTTTTVVSVVGGGCVVDVAVDGDRREPAARDGRLGGEGAETVTCLTSIDHRAAFRLREYTVTVSVTVTVTATVTVTVTRRTASRTVRWCASGVLFCTALHCFALF